MNDFDDDFNQDRKVIIKAPNWFVDAIKEFRIRNSIRIADIDFAMYITLQWEVNKYWIREDTIRLVLLEIGIRQQYIHLPDDRDWEMGRMFSLKMFLENENKQMLESQNKKLLK